MASYKKILVGTTLIIIGCSLLGIGLVFGKTAAVAALLAAA